MHLEVEPITLNLETPFRIAHGTSLARHNVLVRIGDGEHEGLGEAAPVRQHHETQAGVLAYLASLPYEESVRRKRSSCGSGRRMPRRGQ